MKSTLLLLLALVLFGCNRTAPPATKTEATTAPAGTVTIEIRSGDRLETYAVNDVAEGTTLETVMRSLQGVRVNITGSGTTAFLHSIGDQETGGGEGWTYTIDGEFAEAGIGTTELSPPATITWIYGDEVPLE